LAHKKVYFSKKKKKIKNPEGGVFFISKHRPVTVLEIEKFMAECPDISLLWRKLSNNYMLSFEDGKNKKKTV
jgi:hypothetical protein